MAGMLAVLLIAASILLISNTIRLSLFARRREVEVMKLVGATDWFIRWPFVIEGVIVGALGALLAILLLAVGKVALIDPLASDFALIAAPDTIGFGVLIAVLMAAGIGSRRSAPASRCAASCGSETLALDPRRIALDTLGTCLVEHRESPSLPPAPSSSSPCCCWGSASAATRACCRSRSATRSSPTTTRSWCSRRSTRSTTIYYRRSTRDQLVDEASRAPSTSLDDRFSHYFDPQNVQALPACRRTPASAASA